MSNYSFQIGDLLLNRFTILGTCELWLGTEVYRAMDIQKKRRVLLMLTNPHERPLYLEDRTDGLTLFSGDEEVELFRAEIENQDFWVQVSPFNSLLPFMDTSQDLESRPAESCFNMFSGLLGQLLKLHGMKYPMCLNFIHPFNVWVERTTDGWRARFTCFTDISRYSTPEEPWESGNNNWFKANEAFQGVSDARTDIFAMGCLLFYFLRKKFPWKDEEATDDYGECIIRSCREKEPDWGFLLEPGYSGTLAFLKKAMSLDPQERFQTIEEMTQAFFALRDELVQLEEEEEDDDDPFFGPNFPQSNPGQPSIQLSFQKPTGNGGFNRVAGMEELKTMLKREVLFALKNPDVAEIYRLKPLNGMVLYGPPGCGKTFIAENFAEESGMNYALVKASDLGNVFIHGSQSLIRSLFEKAQQNAPCVIYFDEIDALLPRRNPTENHMAGEVNEFLSQLNNCSERGIFVMGSTNRPDLIDPAVLRAGRLEKLVYVPMPDKAAREALFQHELKDRPLYISGGNEVDTEALATMTEGFVSADICHLVNQAALDAAIAELPIGMSDLVARIKQSRRSVSENDVKKYESLRARMEGKKQEKDHRIGFVSGRYTQVPSLQTGAA